MIQYSHHTLSNGLTLLVHQDPNTPLCTINLLYNVGARDEESHRTGFAHLFEHLMFGGTKQVPSFDEVVDSMGGESNAFTNNDYTNYYLTIPAEQLEKALWLEADRMRLLDFSQKSLDVQKQVVTEEYHQRYENQPYGDVWMLLRPLCYKTHPYRWNTIGATIRHVAQAKLSDVEAFFYRYYRPDNCIMAVAGNVKDEEVLRLVEKYFGDIPRGTEQYDPTLAPCMRRTYPKEHEQIEQRFQTVSRNVPSSALYMVFPMCHRLDQNYYAFDLISDILSNGNSSRLYNSLVKEQGIFTEVNAYISGETDPGLFVVKGSLCDGITTDQAQESIWKELQRLIEEPVADIELEKVVNKFESTFLFSQYKAADRALGLCYYYWIGHPEWANTEPENYRKVTPQDIQRVARNTFVKQKSSILEYLAE